MRKRWIAGSALLTLVACEGPAEPARVAALVTVGAEGPAEVETDLGYTVHLTEARLALRDLRFNVAGENHARAAGLRWLLGVAHAHPGHGQGGAVTGELPGRFVADFVAGVGLRLGVATLLEGDYRSADFEFDRSPLLGGEHSLQLAGSASRVDGARVRFEARVETPPRRRLEGVPFEARVQRGQSPALALRLAVRDPFEDDTLFDGVDFAALTPDDDGVVRLVPQDVDPDRLAAYLTLRRAAMSHDHYLLVLSAPRTTTTERPHAQDGPHPRPRPDRRARRL